MKDDDIRNVRTGYDGWSLVYDRDGNPLLTHPGSGEVVCPGSLPHQICDFVMSALAAGFQLDYIGEQAADVELAARYPRAERYVGWPMLVIFRLGRRDG